MSDIKRQISQADARRYMVHSGVLNRVLWDLGMALGVIPDGSVQFELSEEAADRIVESACEVIRQVRFLTVVDDRDIQQARKRRWWRRG